MIWNQDSVTRVFDGMHHLHGGHSHRDNRCSKAMSMRCDRLSVLVCCLSSATSCRDKMEGRKGFTCRRPWGNISREIDMGAET